MRKVNNCYDLKSQFQGVCRQQQKTRTVLLETALYPMPGTTPDAHGQCSIKHWCFIPSSGLCIAGWRSLTDTWCLEDAVREDGAGWRRLENKPGEEIKEYPHRSSLWQRICRGGARRPPMSSSPPRFKIGFPHFAGEKTEAWRGASVSLSQSQSQSGRAWNGEPSSFLRLPHLAFHSPCDASPLLSANQ